MPQRIINEEQIDFLRSQIDNIDSHHPTDETARDLSILLRWLVNLPKLDISIKKSKVVFHEFIHLDYTMINGMFEIYSNHNIVVDRVKKGTMFNAIIKNTDKNNVLLRLPQNIPSTWIDEIITIPPYGLVIICVTCASDKREDVHMDVRVY